MKDAIDDLDAIVALLESQGYDVVGFDGCQYDDGSASLNVEVAVTPDTKNQSQIK